MYQEDDFEKKISLRFIQTLNRHLPKKRKTLKEHLQEDKPYTSNLDGTTHSFDRKEMEKLASLIPEWEHSRFRLPIYLEMSSTMERGTIRISGRIECRIMKMILDDSETSEKRDSEQKESMTIYYPHLAKIRRELPTTTQYMFTF